MWWQVSADGTRLLFYFGFGASEKHHPNSVKAVHADYIEATGVATLRRDGFVGVAPRPHAENGRLITRPLLLSSARLFVNVVLPSAASTLRVEVLSGAGRRANASAAASAWAKECGLGGKRAPKLSGPIDSVKAEVGFPSQGGLGALIGRRVRLRFTLSGAGSELFAFWFTDAPDGRSGGYLGGGQIGRKGAPIDN